MLSEFSHLFLLLVLFLTLFQFFPFFSRYVISFSIFQFLFVTFAFFSCVLSFLISDFSITNVLEHSHSDLPILYKISASWGNHEGSILLWTWILSLYSFLYTLSSSPQLWSLRIQSIMISFFTLFTLSTSNPLLKITLPFENGSELNPVLQDPVLAIHPPFIYLGYLGSVISFSIAIHALINRDSSFTVLSQIRVWSLSSWIFLTIGILLGSWWAYYELGWGGWWFWDPVENSSLMPWLLNTALIHSCKSERLSSSTLLLSLFNFLLSVLGTFFVRSGFLESVHSFAQDQGRGILLLLLCVSLFFFLLFLLFQRLSFFFQKDSLQNPIQKEYSFFLLILFMIAMTLLLLFGTFYPFLHHFLFQQSVSLGASFYQSFLSSLSPAFFLIMILSSYLNWKSNWNASRFFLHLLSFTFFYLSLLFLFSNWHDFLSQISFHLFSFLSFFGLWSILLSFRSLSLSGALAHFGVFLFSIGALFSSYYQLEATYVLKIGEQFHFHGLDYFFHSVNQFQGPNYHSSYATLFAFLDGTPLFSIYPEKRFYFLHGLYSTKPYVLSHFLGDLYVLLGDGNLQDGWEFKIYWNPFLSFLWIGGFFLVLSGLSAYRKARQNL
uniref:Heme lyase n=1 Tax=Andalucia godoyi TaxID=505711 RepID=M4QKL0_ANDGO|nr:heme lyase [Andalucia godoyi]AGH24008.1 heme lyase [Andalucia godoyi]